MVYVTKIIFIMYVMNIPLTLFSYYLEKRAEVAEEKMVYFISWFVLSVLTFWVHLFEFVVYLIVGEASLVAALQKTYNEEEN